MPVIHSLMRQCQWVNVQNSPAVSYTCGFCGTLVSSEKGYQLKEGSQSRKGVYICPKCNCPTFHDPGGSIRIPDSPPGAPVQNVPPDLNAMYEEARICVADSCYNAAVLLSRKMLMHIAVSQNAQVGLSFQGYVDYLANNHYVPPNGKGWVDHIRKKGNEATHEITAMSREDAVDLLVFIEMLLRLIYEFPAKINP